MKKKTAGALMFGGAIGAGLGILFAPRKGSETRKLVSKKLDEIIKEVKSLDYDDVKIQIEEKIEEIKDELSELDREKVLEIAKEKGKLIKEKIDELSKLAKEKASPVISDSVEELRKSAIKATKEVLNKLEGAEGKKKN